MPVLLRIIDVISQISSPFAAWAHNKAPSQVGSVLEAAYKAAKKNDAAKRLLHTADTLTDKCTFAVDSWVETNGGRFPFLISARAHLIRIATFFEELATGIRLNLYPPCRNIVQGADDDDESLDGRVDGIRNWLFSASPRPSNYSWHTSPSISIYSRNDTRAGDSDSSEAVIEECHEIPNTVIDETIEVPVVPVAQRPLRDPTPEDAREDVRHRLFSPVSIATNSDGAGIRAGSAVKDRARYATRDSSMQL